MLAFLLSTLESNEDKEIFTKIYEQYRPLMERTATRILKEPSDIEDAVQNAFVQIILIRFMRFLVRNCLSGSFL